ASNPTPAPRTSTSRTSANARARGRRASAMCFKNLPVEFDENGVAHLKEGVADPYSYEVTEVTPIEQDEAKLKQLLERNGHIRQVDFDPVTRVAGALAFHTVVDLASRKVLDADSMPTRVG